MLIQMKLGSGERLKWLWFGQWCWHFVNLLWTFLFPNMDSGKKNGVPIKGTLLVIWTHHALVSHLMQMDCVTRCWNSYIYFSWHVDSRELKRERDRAQSASLTHQEQKNERKRRHHGAYRMKNGITMRAESEISQQHTIDLTGMNPILPSSCLNKPIVWTNQHSVLHAVFLGVLTGTDPQFCTGGDDDELEWLHMSDWSNRDAGCGQGTRISSHC